MLFCNCDFLHNNLWEVFVAARVYILHCSGAVAHDYHRGGGGAAVACEPARAGEYCFIGACCAYSFGDGFGVIPYECEHKRCCRRAAVDGLP